MPQYLPRAVIFYREGLGLHLRGFTQKRSEIRRQASNHRTEKSHRASPCSDGHRVCGQDTSCSAQRSLLESYNRSSRVRQSACPFKVNKDGRRRSLGRRWGSIGARTNAPVPDETVATCPDIRIIYASSREFRVFHLYSREQSCSERQSSRPSVFLSLSVSLFYVVGYIKSPFIGPLAYASNDFSDRPFRSYRAFRLRTDASWERRVHFHSQPHPPRHRTSKHRISRSSFTYPEDARVSDASW